MTYVKNDKIWLLMVCALTVSTCKSEKGQINVYYVNYVGASYIKAVKPSALINLSHVQRVSIRDTSLIMFLLRKMEQVDSWTVSEWDYIDARIVCTTDLGDTLAFGNYVMSYNNRFYEVDTAMLLRIADTFLPEYRDMVYRFFQ